MTQCTNCGGAHPRWECKQLAKKSPIEAKKTAGSLPVTTAPVKAEKLGANASKSGVTGGESAASIPKRSVGRPKTLEGPQFDRNAYQRAYMVKWKKGLVGKKHVSDINQKTMSESADDFDIKTGLVGNKYVKEEDK